MGCGLWDVMLLSLTGVPCHCLIMHSCSCRCDLERGPGKVQLLARLLPNIFQDGYKPTVIEPLVDKIRANLFGAEATDPLDFLQVRGGQCC